MTKGEALVTADIHLAISPRDRYRLRYMQTMPDRLKRMDATAFCILGDLCEQKDFHNSWMVNQLTDLIAECAIYCKVWILLGNHDYVDRAHPFFAYLRHLRNVEFITEPCIKKVQGIGNVVWLPHTRNPERDWEAVALTDAFEQCDVVFAHQTFEGAMVANGKRLSGVSPKLLGNKQIISGDIHVPQTAGQVEYVGSPYRIDYGDEWDGRLLRFVDGKRMKDVPVSCPQKRLIAVRTPAKIRDAQFNRDDILKVVVDPSPDTPWAQIVSEARNVVLRMGAVAEQVVPSSTVQLGAKHKRIRITDAGPKDDKQVVEAYGKRVGVDARTLKTGKLIMDRSKR